MLACNVAVPQLLWLPRVRSNAVVLWLISLAVNLGMWLERYVIVVTSLTAGIFCHHPGVCTTGQFETMPPSTARSACLLPSCSCSSGSCP